MNRHIENLVKRTVAFFALWVFGPLLLSAQPDHTDLNSDTSATYLTPMEYAFMMHEEPRFMLRLPFIGVGVEAELLPYFTFMAQASLDHSDYFGGGLRMESELRWYYSSRKMAMRNMSGNYLAAGVRVFDQDNFYAWVDGQFPESNMFAYLRWGMQRRMLGNGLIDMGVLAGYQPFTAIEGTQGYDAFRISTTTTLGLGLVFGNRKELDWQRLCPVTKCYDVEQFMMKVNVANALNYRYFPVQGGHVLWVNPKIAFEYKILQSAFSVNANVSYNLGISNPGIEGSGFQSDWQFLDLRIEGRYYYNLKRRMLQGKGGNGLSGNYIAVGAMQEHYGYDMFNNSGKIEPYITTGIQRTLGKRFYIDVNVGVVGQRNGSTNKLTVFPIGDMQIGFRF